MAQSKKKLSDHASIHNHSSLTGWEAGPSELVNNINPENNELNISESDPSDQEDLELEAIGDMRQESQSLVKADDDGELRETAWQRFGSEVKKCGMSLRLALVLSLLIQEVVIIVALWALWDAGSILNREVVIRMFTTFLTYSAGQIGVSLQIYNVELMFSYIVAYFSLFASTPTVQSVTNLGVVESNFASQIPYGVSFNVTINDNLTYGTVNGLGTSVFDNTFDSFSYDFQNDNCLEYKVASTSMGVAKTLTSSSSCANKNATNYDSQYKGNLYEFMNSPTGNPILIGFVRTPELNVTAAYEIQLKNMTVYARNESTISFVYALMVPSSCAVPLAIEEFIISQGRTDDPRLQQLFRDVCQALAAGVAADSFSYVRVDDTLVSSVYSVIPLGDADPHIIFLNVLDTNAEDSELYWVNIILVGFALISTCAIVLVITRPISKMKKFLHELAKAQTSTSPDNPTVFEEEDEDTFVEFSEVTNAGRALKKRQLLTEEKIKRQNDQKELLEKRLKGYKDDVAKLGDIITPTKPLNVFVGSWNVGNAEPDSMNPWFSGEHDIVAIGVQECVYGKNSAQHFFSVLSGSLGPNYTLIDRVNIASGENSSLSKKEKELEKEVEKEKKKIKNLLELDKDKKKIKNLLKHRHQSTSDVAQELARTASKLPTANDSLEQQQQQPSSPATDRNSPGSSRWHGRFDFSETPEETGASSAHLGVPGPSGTMLVDGVPISPDDNHLQTNASQKSFEKVEVREGVNLADPSGSGGLRLFVYVLTEHLPFVTNLRRALRPTGLAKRFWNKGGVAISFSLYGSSFCFVSSHLAAHQAKIKERNEDWKNIVTGLKEGISKEKSSVPFLDQFHYVFWCGDLNYRIDLEHQECLSLITLKKIGELYKRDQLNHERRHGRVFYRFEEPPINFLPTYKMDRGYDSYESVQFRIPSWCDRILYKSYPNRDVETLAYDFVKDIKSSDHRPIYGTYKLSLPLPNLPLTRQIPCELSLTNILLTGAFIENFEDPLIKIVSKPTGNDYEIFKQVKCRSRHKRRKKKLRERVRSSQAHALGVGGANAMDSFIIDHVLSPMEGEDLDEIEEVDDDYLEQHGFAFPDMRIPLLFSDVDYLKEHHVILLIGEKEVPEKIYSVVVSFKDIVKNKVQPNDTASNIALRSVCTNATLQAMRVNSERINSERNEQGDLSSTTTTMTTDSVQSNEPMNPFLYSDDSYEMINEKQNLFKCSEFDLEMTKDVATDLKLHVTFLLDI